MKSELSEIAWRRRISDTILLVLHLGFFIGSFLCIVLLSLSKYQIIPVSDDYLVWATVSTWLFVLTSIARGNLLVSYEIARRDNSEKAILFDPGFIYLLQRSDKIYKIGKTKNVPSRILEHCKDYQTEFIIVAVWLVPNCSVMERVALRQTKSYSYKEGNRLELRQMDELQLSTFIEIFSSQANVSKVGEI